MRYTRLELLLKGVVSVFLQRQRFILILKAPMSLGSGIPRSSNPAAFLHLAHKVSKVSPDPRGLGVHEEYIGVHKPAI